MVPFIVLKHGRIFITLLCELSEFVEVNTFLQDHLHTLKEAADHDVPPLPAMLA